MHYLRGFFFITYTELNSHAFKSQNCLLYILKVNENLLSSEYFSTKNVNKADQKKEDISETIE